MGILREYCFRKLRRVLMELNKIKHFHFFIKVNLISWKACLTSYLLISQNSSNINICRSRCTTIYSFNMCKSQFSLTAYFSDRLSRVLWLHTEKTSILKSRKSCAVESSFVYRYLRLKNITVFLLLVCMII